MKDREELFALDPALRVSLELFENETSQQRADKMFQALKDDIFYIRLRQIVWKEFCEEESSDEDFDRRLNTLIEETGLKEVIKTIFLKTQERSIALHGRNHPLLSDPLPATLYTRRAIDESLDCVASARIAWEEGVNEELQAIAKESRKPFYAIRDPAEMNPLLEQTQDFFLPVGVQPVSAGNSQKETPPQPVTASSNSPIPHAQDPVKFLFDSEDLLDTAISIKNPNSRSQQTSHYIGLMSLPLDTLTLDEIISRFPELSSKNSQLGSDEVHTGPTGITGPKLSATRHDEGESLLQYRSTNGNHSLLTETRRYMRRGVPPALRSRIWRAALGLNPDDTLGTEEQTFLRLRYECDRLEMLTDELFIHDIQTVVDDPRFFIFEDEIKEIVLCFSRDDYIRYNAHYQIHTPLEELMVPECPPATAFPPSAVQPFLGFATYFSPLGYIFRNKASFYSVSRELFCRLWCKMNVLNCDSDTLLTVCRTFECLLMQCHPSLFIHLVNIGVQPLKIAFPWMQLGFVGVLEVDQLLHLWDRLIGYMDPLLLAVTAVAIFMDRSEMLLRCLNEGDATAVLTEASRLHIIPLIQMILYQNQT